MKSGQCPKCGSHDVHSNTNRKFPALNTITLSSGTSSERYAPLDTYICVTCGYVESYVAKPSDLNYIKDEWASVEVSDDSDLQAVSEVAAPLLSAERLPSTSMTH
jgi:predicted nucleic-acid-binding Zn-ribbon protein